MKEGWRGHCVVCDSMVTEEGGCGHRVLGTERFLTLCWTCMSDIATHWLSHRMDGSAPAIHPREHQE